MTDICHKLESLTLSPRAPECLVPALIPHMGGLRALTSLMLRCRGPPITSFTWEGFAEAVSRLVCLRQLHLYPLDGLPPRWMSNLFNSLRSAPHLEDLHLSGTDPNQPLVVGNAFGELLLSVPHLTRVCLQNAEIEPSQLFWKALHKMPRLAKLSLWNTEVRSRSERATLPFPLQNTTPTARASLAWFAGPNANVDRNLATSRVCSGEAHVGPVSPLVGTVTTVSMDCVGQMAHVATIWIDTSSQALIAQWPACS